jgi:hypothetical protein
LIYKTPLKKPKTIVLKAKKAALTVPKPQKPLFKKASAKKPVKKGKA